MALASLCFAGATTVRSTGIFSLFTLMCFAVYGDARIFDLDLINKDYFKVRSASPSFCDEIIYWFLFVLREHGSLVCQHYSLSHHSSCSNIIVRLYSVRGNRSSQTLLARGAVTAHQCLMVSFKNCTGKCIHFHCFG